jgi:septum formation protein
VTDLILASASPRRADLLRQIGVTFTVQSADIDESRLASEAAEDYVTRLAREKAAAVAVALEDDGRPVLAADTCVVMDGELLGKPVDRADAMAMLSLLSGREHRVLTGVCLQSGGAERVVLSDTRVRFLELAKAACEAYIDSGEPFDKAGAYGIQGPAAAFVAGINGSYTGVVGLPLAETWQLLTSAGVPTVLDAAHE